MPQYVAYPAASTGSSGGSITGGVSASYAVWTSSTTVGPASLFEGNLSASFLGRGIAGGVHALDINLSDAGLKLSGTCEFFPVASGISGIIAGAGMYVYNSNRTGFSGLYTSYLVAEAQINVWNSSNGRTNVTLAKLDGLRLSTDAPTIGWSATGDAAAVQDIVLTKLQAGMLSLSGNIQLSGTNFLGFGTSPVLSPGLRQGNAGDGTSSLLCCQVQNGGVNSGTGPFQASTLYATTDVRILNGSTIKVYGSATGLALSSDANLVWSSTNASLGAADISMTRVATNTVAFSGSFYHSGSVALTASRPTANYTVAANDCYIGLSGSTITGTLPSAAGSALGKIYFVKNENQAAVAASQNMIKPAATDRIDGIAAGTGLSLSASQGLILYCSNPTNWYVLARV